MTENSENIIKLDIKSLMDMCQKIETLKAENEALKDENETYFETCEDLIKQIHALKSELSEVGSENCLLKSEIADIKFTKKCLNSEEAGKAFARELLGKPMTPEEVAIDAAENGYKPYVGDDF